MLVCLNTHTPTHAHIPTPTCTHQQTHTYTDVPPHAPTHTPTPTHAPTHAPTSTRMRTHTRTITCFQSSLLILTYRNMSICTICNKKITWNHHFYSNSSVCVKCTMKLKNCDYKIITTVNDFADDNISNIVATILPQNNMEEEELLLIDSSEKIAIDCDIAIKVDPMLNCTDNHKNTLLASLYSQV